MTKPRNSYPVIGQAITRLRKQAHITQIEMAARLGITQAAYSKWETTGKIPGIPELPALAKALGVSMEDLAKLAQEPTLPGL